jgi:membrane-associated phospholipid phosphatase
LSKYLCDLYIISMKRILIAVFCFISIGVNAQVVTDTTKKNLGDTLKKDILTAPDTVPKLRSKFLSFVPPLILVGYGASSFFVHPVRRLDYYVQTEVREHFPTFHSVAESYFQFAPVAAVYALNFAGIEGKNRFLDRSVLLGLSAAIVSGSLRITKKATHRLRPNGEDYYSFPSGHTATAFMGAEFLAQEFSGKSVWYGVAGYAVAASTGVFRIGNRDHWFSDTVAGAGYGILSTKLAYYIYPYMRDLLTKKGKSGKTTVIMPTYQDGTAGLYFTMQL